MRRQDGIVEIAIYYLLQIAVLSGALYGQASAPSIDPGQPVLSSPSVAPSPVLSNSALQQRVLKPERQGEASSLGSAAEKHVSRNDPQTLHIVVGRSLLIDTPDRLRRVFVANPAVLDSLTSSPNQIVLTAKLAGTSTVVLWGESGHSRIYTVLADLDVSDLAER